MNLTELDKLKVYEYYSLLSNAVLQVLPLAELRERAAPPIRMGISKNLHEQEGYSRRWTLLYHNGSVLNDVGVVTLKNSIESTQGMSIAECLSTYGDPAVAFCEESSEMTSLVIITAFIGEIEKPISLRDWLLNADEGRKTVESMMTSDNKFQEDVTKAVIEWFRATASESRDETLKQKLGTLIDDLIKRGSKE